MTDENTTETHTYPDGSARVGCPPFPKLSPLQEARENAVKAAANDAREAERVKAVIDAELEQLGFTRGAGDTAEPIQPAAKKTAKKGA